MSLPPQGLRGSHSSWPTFGRGARTPRPGSPLGPPDARVYHWLPLRRRRGRKSSPCKGFQAATFRSFEAFPPNAQPRALSNPITSWF